MPELDPSHVMQVGMGFFASKALLSAVELGLFTALGQAANDSSGDSQELGLACPRCTGFSGYPRGTGGLAPRQLIGLGSRSPR
jgi:hypothetical protein